MIKIETAVQVSQAFPAGKSSEYIWMSGQPWPVSPDEDSKIIRIEVFGNELDELAGRFSCQHVLRSEDRVTCLTWYLQDARYVSEQMRIFYPQA